MQSALKAGCCVDALCLACNHIRALDLARLAQRGHEKTPLIGLPLRCAVCQATAFRVIVSGQTHR